MATKIFFYRDLTKPVHKMYTTAAAHYHNYVKYNRKTRNNRRKCVNRING